MEIQKKIRYFEYLISLLIKWHIEVAPNNKDAYKQDFSRLKVLKLLFFASAVNADESNEHNGLLDIFDNFYALPHGPVESDIYNAIVGNEIPQYQLTERSLIEREEREDYDGLDNNVLHSIDLAVEALRSKNNDLIQYKAFDLVDISHRWSCWTISCEIAKLLGKGSVEIPHSLIKSSQKYYIL